MVASLAQAVGLQSGPPQPVGTVRRLVLPSVERLVRWGASLLHRRRHVTANLVPDLDGGLFRQTPGTMPGGPSARSISAVMQRLPFQRVAGRIGWGGLQLGLRLGLRPGTGFLGLLGHDLRSVFAYLAYLRDPDGHKLVGVARQAA